MTVTFDMSSEESQKLRKAADMRAHRLYGPQWLSKLHWWVFLPVTVAAIGYWVDRFDVAIVAFLAFWGLNTGSNKLYLWLYAKKKKADERNPTGNRWIAAIEGSFLLLKSADIEVHYAWTRFHSTDQTDLYLFLRTSPINAVVIPKRAFGSKEDIDAFVTTADEKIKKAASSPQL
jgi:hypothetical protein